MKNLLTILMAIILLPTYGQRQINFGNQEITRPIKRCLTMDELYKNRPEERRRVQQVRTQAFAAAKYRDLNRSTQGTVRRIPVVVHVYHDNGTEKISEAQIKSQITVLNNDYRRTNTDKTNTPSDFSSVAADTEIEFFIATKDPNGNVTTGINYVQSSNYTNFDVESDEQGMKSTSQWDPSKYLNIWVVKEIVSGGQSGILGYAYMPGGDASTDGLVIIHNAFGTTGSVSSQFGGGRTATHEIGHYLGLSHVWGDNGGCSNDDNIDDTPMQEQSNYDCPSHPKKSCSNNGDMFMNYMDYVNDACMNMFTKGQSNVMNQHLDNTVRRKNLYTEANLTATGYTSDGGSTDNETDSGTETGSGTDTGTDTGSTTDSTSENTGETTGENVYSSISLETSSTSNCGFFHYPPTNNTVMKSDDGIGYITGHNGYKDQAKADLFTNSDNLSHIFGVAMRFNIAKSNAPLTSTFNVVVWSDDNGKPGNKIYTKQQTYQSIIEENNKPYFTFSEPVAVSGNNFFVGIEFTYKDGDTLSLAGNQLQSGNTSFELWENNAWYAFSNSDSWGAHAQLWIFPRVGNLIDLEATSDVSEICVGSTLTLSASNTSNVNSFTWSFNNTNIENNSNSVSIEITEAGTFNYSLVATGTCNSITDGASINASICTDIEEMEQYEVLVYPNPANNLIHIENDNEIQTISIYNNIGVRVIQTTQLTIDVSNLNNGIYFMVIQEDTRMIPKKIQIQK